MTPVVSVVIDTHSDELILDSVAELESDAHKFEMAKSNLQKLLDQPYPEINDLIKNFLIHVQELEDKAKSKKSKNESTVELTAAMNHTYRALTDPTFREEFHLIAKDMEGHASTRMKVIAGIMLALSVAILTLSIVFAPALAGLAPLLFITGKAIGITVGLTGGALAVGGFTFFAKSGESGLAKTAHKINKELINDSVVYNSTAPAA